MSALERKAAAYDAIARAYGLGTSEANVDRCVTVATYARELRDEAMRTRDMAVDAGIALRARVAELETELDGFSRQRRPRPGGWYLVTRSLARVLREMVAAKRQEGVGAE